MKRILLYIDHPSGSKDLMKYCVHLARDLKYSITFLNVFNPEQFQFGVGADSGAAVQVTVEAIENQTNENRKLLQGYINEIASSIPDTPPLDYEIEAGDPNSIIKQRAMADDVEMVLLQETGRKSGFLISDSNLNVIRFAEKPVWVVQSPPVYKPLKNIIYATDYHEEDLPVMNKLTRLAKAFYAKITVLHVTEDLNFEEEVRKTGYQELLKEKTGYDAIDLRVLVDKEDENVVENIDRFATEEEADMVAMLKRERSLFQRMFHKSHTQELIAQTTLPVLIYHEKGLVE